VRRYTKALPAHCLNVFIPLVDVPLEKGPTEFKPNTQEFTKDTFRQMVGARARGELPPNQTPTLKVGDALLFDYRVLHRGRANVSAEPRPVMVLTYSNEWFDDIYNFPPPSKSLLKEGKAVEFVVGAEEDGSGLADLSLSGSLNALVYAAAPGAPVPSSVADLVEQFPDRVFVLGAERPSVTIGDSLFALSPLPPSAPAPPPVFHAATTSPVATPLPVLSCSSKKPKRQTYACPPGSRVTVGAGWTYSAAPGRRAEVRAACSSARAKRAQGRAPEQHASGAGASSGLVPSSRVRAERAGVAGECRALVCERE
jgi:hypothetical protein